MEYYNTLVLHLIMRKKKIRESTLFSFERVYETAYFIKSLENKI
jgi:hypothetical protein